MKYVPLSLRLRINVRIGSEIMYISFRYVFNINYCYFISETLLSYINGNIIYLHEL